MKKWRKYELDAFKGDIPSYKKHTEEVLAFHWEFYNELAFQRSAIYEDLKLSVLEHARDGLSLRNWQRAVKYKYTLDPLNMRGSLSDPGGRFNVGDIDPLRFSSFPALYASIDKQTAIAELLGQTSDATMGGFTPFEMALTSPNSLTVVQLNGELESVIDLRDEESVTDFLDLVKDFKISKTLIRKAEKLKTDCSIIRTVPALMDSFLTPDWRRSPALFDIPANSQIFGQIVRSAGIQGIVYPSKFSKKDCVSIFPLNFGDESYVELAGDLPADVKQKRIDKDTLGVDTL